MARYGIDRPAAIHEAEQLFQLLRQHREALAKFSARQTEDVPKPLGEALVERSAPFWTDVNAKSLWSGRGGLVALVDLDRYTGFLQPLGEAEPANAPADDPNVKFVFHFLLPPDRFVNCRLAWSDRIQHSVCR
jgi:hypothetical protein